MALVSMRFRCSQEYVVGILVALGTWILLHAFRATYFLLLGLLRSSMFPQERRYCCLYHHQELLFSLRACFGLCGHCILDP